MTEAANLRFLLDTVNGLKSSGAAFRELLANTLYNIEYTPSKTDPNIWIRPEFKPDGFEYYEMRLC